jgi:PncC family amidohydrolase
MFFSSDLKNQITEILNSAQKKNLKIATAESCTGGLLSALFTEISGSSKIFERGFVTYSNEAKISMLEVKKETLEKFGAVSEEVAKEMAIGAIKNSLADLSVAITGIAGPDGGTDEKPVGLVHIACFNKKNQKLISRKFNFSGDRFEIRKSALISSLQLLMRFF